MADAVVTKLREVKAEPKQPTRRPSRSDQIVFDGAGDTSTVIEKQNFGLLCLSVPTGTAVYTLLGAQTPGGTFRLIQGVSLDSATDNSLDITEAAACPFIKLKQSVAESKTAELGMI